MGTVVGEWAEWTQWAAVPARAVDLGVACDEGADQRGVLGSMPMGERTGGEQQNGEVRILKSRNN